MKEHDVHALKEKLLAEAKKKFPDSQEKQHAYIYGTLRRLGWKPKDER